MERRLAAILAADMVGYSRLMAADEAGTLARVSQLRKERLEPLIESHRGRVFKLMGDGVLVEFASVVDAVNCAVAWQKSMTEEDLLFRIGVNIGDVIVEDGDVYGNGVNVAARLEAIAEPGGICLSGNVYDEVRGKLNLTAEDMGAQTVKNIDMPVRIFRVVCDVNEPGDISKLSPRELEIAQAYAGGADPLEIAERLLIAPNAVSTHVATIYRKLGVSSKIELFRLLQPIEPEKQSVGSGRRTFEVSERPSIAVLPFMCMSGDPEQEFFADGLTEDIITRLSFLRNLIVMARTSTFAFKGRAIRVQDIASELGAKFLLEGSVRKSGNRVRVTAQLIDGSTGAHLWAERFDRDLHQVFDVQDEITRSIVDAMQVRLVDGEVVKTDPGWTKNIDAWEKYHKGVFAHLLYTAQDGLRARRLFEECLEHDPDFIDAKVYLAWTYWQDARSGFSNDRSRSLSTTRSFVDEMKAAKVTTANFKHLEAATLLLERRHDEALEIAEKAVAAGPCKLFGFTPSSLVFYYSGLTKKAHELHRMTIRLTPYTPNDVVYNLAWTYTSLGEHSSAIEMAQDYFKRVPSDLYRFVVLARALAFAKSMDLAFEIVGDLKQSYPNFTIRDLIAHEPYRDEQEIKRLSDVFRQIGLPDE